MKILLSDRKATAPTSKLLIFGVGSGGRIYYQPKTQEKQCITTQFYRVVKNLLAILFKQSDRNVTANRAAVFLLAKMPAR